MENITKAQLILVGGRAAVPNILTVIHQKPQVVIAVCSKESQPDFPKLKEAINKILPDCIVEETTNSVDAFAPDDIKIQCEQALQKYPKAKWIFNITAATTIMSIVAYEVAKSYQQTCWYLNTSQARIVTLSGQKGDESVFNITVDQYVTAYNRELIPGDLEDRRSQSEVQWLPFACTLGQNPHYATTLKYVMSKVGKDKKGRPSKSETKEYILQNAPDEAYMLLTAAKQVGLLEDCWQDKFGNIIFQLSYLQDKFLNGAWLEAYVWYQAKSIGIFQDHQWNQRVIEGKSKNELDVSMIYKAQLIIVECKTGEEAFESDTLYKLDSVANIFGGRFVGRLLVTSLYEKKPSQDFLAQADSRRIVVVTGEKLPYITTILEKEAKDPTYPRI